MVLHRPFEPASPRLAYTLARTFKGPTMQAVLKGLYSSDIAKVENYQLEEEDNFGLVLRALVGPMGQPAEESFDMTVCTPKWLAERYGTSEILLGLHKVIVFRYDYPPRLRIHPITPAGFAPETN